jgi:hypothetical protein|tara:strand:+ start:15 stop:344 length:330 start_codon:yes stop_codon:yes gene_type:complete
MSQVNDNTEVTIPIRNLIALVAAVAIASWTYAGINERLNIIEHTKAQTSIVMDLNTEFRIKWPRGEMGALPDDSRQDMLLDILVKKTDTLEKSFETLTSLDFRIKSLEK